MLRAKDFGPPVLPFTADRLQGTEQFRIVIFFVSLHTALLQLTTRTLLCSKKSGGAGTLFFLFALVFSCYVAVSQNTWDPTSSTTRPKEITMKDPGSSDRATDKPAGRPASVNATPAVQFDISKLQSSYANVCNVSSTREEVVLAFGVNNGWEREQAQMQVQLTNRIVLNPYAAKRLAGVLNRVLAEYESAFGPLKDDSKPQTNAA